MPKRRLIAFLALAIALAGTPLRAQSELPPEILEATEQAMLDCEGMGGKPEVLPAYETRIDLNGDGIPDILTDLAGLQCTDAWSAFCGSAGCPVTAWLSQPDGHFTRFDFGHVQGFEFADMTDGLPVLRTYYHGTFCGEDRIGADGCSRLWTFASDAPEMPPIEGAEVAETPVAEAGQDVAGDAADATPMFSAPPGLEPGWTLRDVPNSTPLALGGGVGPIAYLAGFCLEDQPFLAIRLDPAPDEEDVTFGFAFSEGSLEAEGRFEPTADGAHVVALAGGALPGRLAGRDSQVEVRMDGEVAGVLSLSGSTRALRGALETCHGF